MCPMIMTAASAVMSLAGGVIQGMAASDQLEAEAQAADARAMQAERQAIIETDVGGIEARRLRRQGTQQLASQINMFAGAGIDPGSGSAAAVIESSAQEIDLDAQAIAFNAELRADNQRFNAEQERFSAATSRSAKSTAFLAPVIGGLGKALPQIGTAISEFA